MNYLKKLMHDLTELNNWPNCHYAQISMVEGWVGNGEVSSLRLGKALISKNTLWPKLSIIFEM